MNTLFTITKDELEKYKENVNKGLYLKKADKGLPEMPQATDALQIDNWRKDCENRMKILSEENEMLQKRCERIELHDKAMVIFNDEQRNAQELVNILKNQLEEKDRKVKKLTNDAETLKQKINTVIGEKYWVIEKKEVLEKENRAFKKKTEILEVQNDMLERINTELENKNNNLNLDIKSLIEKNSEWEALYASGFAGSAVVESDEGAKVVNSDAARENENYKKEIEKKETLINDLSNKLKHKTIPMSSIIDGFKELALLGKEKVSTAYMTLCTMLQDCEAWRTNREEIKNIFVEKNNTAPGTINYNYSAGATHYDHHREITIKKEDNKLLRKE